MPAVQHATVNVHYLDHVMTVAEERQVEATEDIYSENGMKLVAKGYAINRSMRDRLIEHKLIKPLEDCMAVSDGVTGRRCAETAERMLDTYPVLRAICTSGSRVSLVKLMEDSTFAGRLQTLLTVYTEHQAGKLDHAVCVALLALSLAQRMLPGENDVLGVLLVASLSHDVGELYIDPKYLQTDAQLGPKEWRHIAAHPVIAHGLMKDLAGLAKPASALILDHHERLDGFGYPQGRRSGEVPESAQILAVAEMLGGMLDKGGGLLQQAEVAVKLIHGEFSRPVIDAVSKTFRECRDVDAATESEALRDALTRSHELGERLGRIMHVQGEFKPLFDRASPPFKGLWTHAQERFESICRAWSSTGLDVQPDGAWLQHEAPTMQREVAIILKEINWRLGELERELHARVIRHAAGDLPVLERYLKEVRAATGLAEAIAA
ncbi:HD domain-containing phosphohydrolase [Aquabacterium sp.]|uniref:HD-GYP domain-containing protein n=1 Tax=Aquabacterium sp. TaxID=1872578 RepID=UPI0025C5CA7E|nr:HD domain-containing phosphohydrolase [Aquabacterium sp.]